MGQVGRLRCTGRLKQSGAHCPSPEAQKHRRTLGHTLSGVLHGLIVSTSNLILKAPHCACPSSQDPWTLKNIPSRIRAHYPAARLERLPAGHCPHVSRPRVTSCCGRQEGNVNPACSPTQHRVARSWCKYTHPACSRARLWPMIYSPFPTSFPTSHHLHCRMTRPTWSTRTS